MEVKEGERISPVIVPSISISKRPNTHVIWLWKILYPRPISSNTIQKLAAILVIPGTGALCLVVVDELQ